MARKRIRKLVFKASAEVLEFIKEAEVDFEERWVPATYIRHQLDLEFPPYQRDSERRGHEWCLLGVLARVLEDNHLLESREQDGLILYRSKVY